MPSGHDDRPGLSVPDAADAIGISQATLRRYIARGAPVLEPGSSGRGKGARLDASAVIAWLSGAAPDRSNSEILERLATGLQVLFSSECENFGRPAHAVVGLRDQDGAALYVKVFESCAQQLIGRIPGEEDIPIKIKDLITIAMNAQRR